MSATYDDTVFEFDLNYLRQSTNNSSNNSRLERQKKSVTIVKKKVIATDSLIGKYYAKRHELEETEKSLLASKDECKQICIDYTNALETCAKLEAEAQIIQNANKQLEERCFNLENQAEAIKSHANQLQALVNEHKTTVEALEVEKKLHKAAARTNEKKVISLQNENNTYLNHICIFRDIILGKRKLNSKYKDLLSQYEKSRAEKNSDDSLSEDENSDIGDDIFEDVLSPYNDNHSPQNDIIEIKTTSNKHATPMELDNDCSNEIVSIDTGRGSSLAFSDTEKCFHSPDYYIDDSPISRETVDNKVKTKLVNVATSPLTVRTTTEIATSPINVMQDEDVLCQIIIEEENSNSVEYTESPQKQKQTINKSVSPIKFNINKSVLTSPIVSVSKAVATSPVEVTNVPTHNEQTTQEQECLEINNSNNFLDENSNDCEIEKILETMRLSHRVITPIPATPANKSRIIESSSLSNNHSKQKEHSKGYVCEDAALVREENKKLHASIADLAKEIVNIKSLLNNQFLFSKYKMIGNKVDSVFNHGLASDPIEVNESAIKDVNPVLPHTLFVDEATVELNTISKNFNSESSHDLFNGVDNNKGSTSHKNIESLTTNDLCDGEDGNVLNSTPHNNVESLITQLFNDEDTMEVNSIAGDIEVPCEDDNDRNIDSPFLEDPIIIQNPDSQLNPPADTSPSETTTTIQKKEMTSKADHLRNTSPENTPLKGILHRLQFEEMPLSSSAKSTVPLEQTKATNVSSGIDEVTCDMANVVENVKTSKDNHDKIIKSRKLTRLEKLKKKLGPTFKIKRDVTQSTKNKCMKPKQLPPPKKKINVTVSDSAASLNDKNVYDKAVRVMAELKAKQPQTPKYTADKDVNSKHQTITSPLEEMANGLSECCSSPISSITTRSRKKCVEQVESDSEKVLKQSDISPRGNSENVCSETLNQNNEKEAITSPRLNRKRSRQYSETCDIQCKRTLRSSTLQQSLDDNSQKLMAISEHGTELPKHTEVTDKNIAIHKQGATLSTSDLSEEKHAQKTVEHTNVVTYDDLDLFSDERRQSPESNNKSNSVHPKDSILCVMVEKYGVQTVKTSAKKLSDVTTKSIVDKLESEIAKIIELPPEEAKNAMNKFVSEIQKLNYRHFMIGLMNYLTKPERKTELFGKVLVPPAPPMTKSEQVLLYVITQLKSHWPSVDTVDGVLCSIEYTLFKLNHTPHFDVIESISHFYAVMCRYFQAKSRLRLFILDAMYCIQFKSVPLIKQCLDVWMHIIPLAHMGIAKSPLVTCLVYLLHFYKCEDKFNRVQELRNILHRKYFYQITEWNETKILEMFTNSIKDLKDISIEKKMMRLALIILAKRHGARWCQNNIIKNLLLPMIEKENVPDKVKQFCISMIGPLMKPYPVDMKVHCEVALNQLIDIWDKNPSARMDEAVITSLVCMTRHNQNRVNKILLSRKLHEVSPGLENVLRDYVREKPLKVWKNMFAKAHLEYV